LPSPYTHSDGSVGNLSTVSRGSTGGHTRKNQAPELLPRPDPIGTGYIRPCLQFLHCVMIIAAVNECPLHPRTKRYRIISAASSGVRRDETRDIAPAKLRATRRSR
jgi:hypothetical protein